jgi:hypothetical protein
VPDASDAPGADAPDDHGANPDGAPGASDLEGSWYATTFPQRDGGLALHQRIRFASGTYFLVSDTPAAYCGEVGAFQLAGGAVTFTPDHVEGGTRCPAAAARVEPVRFTADGVVFDTAAGAIGYGRARAAPKVFVTFETHDGNIAGDASIQGTFAIDKADAICARSIARPDGATYKALLTDGLRRTALPARDWVLAPDTTYFQADGVLNVFTSSADAASAEAHHGILSDGPSFTYAWTFSRSDATSSTGSCRGWTSNSANDSASLLDASSTGGVGGICNNPYPFVCVTSPSPTGGPDGGATDAGVGDGGATNDPVLEGAWTVAAGSVDAGGGLTRQRIAFDGDRYLLVTEAGNGYCGEAGNFRSTGTSVAFTPQRIEGIGACTIAADHVETLTVGTNDITLSTASSSRRYTRAPDVPKLFATPEIHNGDFADDAVLAGTNAMDKADAFCNRSVARPDGHSYKAVLADGTHRAPSTNWPLQPATQYFDSGGQNLLFTTNPSGLVTGSTAAAPLLRAIQFFYMWTGLDYDNTSKADAVSTNTCNGWTSPSASLYGASADPSSAYTFSSAVVGSCSDVINGLICARQP